MSRGRFLIIGALSLLFATWSAAGADDPAQPDLDAVRTFLKSKFPNDTWERGPTVLSGKAIQRAFPNCHFYYVFSSQYPVARAGQVSAVMQIDDQGIVKHMEQPQDYNNGLMAIHNADDAKTAAAAIMSVMLGPFGPTEIAVDNVQAAADGRGWSAKATAAQGQWEVQFDETGQCTHASYKHTGPLPICIGGLFREVPAPSGLVVGSQTVLTALEVDAVDPQSIAQRAGLQKGDLIVGFSGRPLPNDDTIQKMRQIVYALKQEESVRRRVTVVRDGRTRTLTLRW